MSDAPNGKAAPRAPVVSPGRSTSPPATPGQLASTAPPSDDNTGATREEHARLLADERRGQGIRVLIPKKELNFGGIVCGPPQSGKTTVLRRWVIEHLTNHPTGIAIVHDVQRQFGDICATYESPDDYRAAARAAAATKGRISRGIAITRFDAWEDVANLAIGLGERHNTADAVRVPIMLASDETSSMGTSGSTHMHALDLRLMTQRRHAGIAMALNVQRPNSLTVAFWDLATEVIMFRQNSEQSCRDLEVKLGLPKHALQGLLGAEPYQFVRWKAGEGLS